MRKPPPTVTHEPIGRIEPRGWLALLSRPPVPALDARRLAAVRQFTRRVETALACVLMRPVRIELAPPPGDTAPPERSAFRSTLRLDSGEAELWLDEPAARALIWPLLDELAGLPACLPLGETERGVLKYVLLAAADKLAAACNAGDSPFAFEQLAVPDTWSDEAAITAKLRCGALTGWLAARWDERLESAIRALPPAPPEALGDPITVTLELPPIPLSEAERRAIEPGDCLLLDGREMSDLASRCGVVTTTGWRLATLEALEDAPTHVTAHCDAWDPRPLVSDAQASDHALCVRLGQTRLTEAQIREWDRRRTLRFAKNPETPALLCHEGRPIGSGELVRCDDELAVRVVSWSPPWCAPEPPDESDEPQDDPPSDAQDG